MTNIIQADFYCVGDKEYIDADCVEEAVQEWYDGCYREEHPAPKKVLVTGWSKQTIPESSHLFQWELDSLYATLDENYGCDETSGDYELSDEAKLLWEAFTAQVAKEYPVAQLKEVGEFWVEVRDYISVGE